MCARPGRCPYWNFTARGVYYVHYINTPAAVCVYVEIKKTVILMRYATFSGGVDGHHERRAECRKHQRQRTRRTEISFFKLNDV